MASTGPPTGTAALTAWSLAALAAGLLLGTLGHAFPHPGFAALAALTTPLGDAWLAALQAIVLPLVVAHILAAVTGGTGAVGALGARAVALFVVLLLAAGALTIVAAGPLIALYPADPAAVVALDAATVVPPAAREAASASGGTVGAWVSALVPSNLLAAALRGDVLPLLLFATVFGLAVTRLPDAQRLPLSAAFRAIAAAMLVVVRWVLLVTPIGVFALIYALALRRGSAAAGLLGAHVAVQACVLLLCTALLYPLAATLGRVPLRAFARAVLPAQLVAVSTRSSLATLPALVEGARRHLALPDAATGFVLPLGVSVFKLNRTVSSTAKALFLAHVYAVPLDLGALTTFLLTLVLLSFTSVGVPGGGSAFKTMPAYLALGIPIEGVVVLEAVESVPDVFKTLLNVTGDMTAATLLTHARPATLAVPPAIVPPAAAPASQPVAAPDGVVVVGADRRTAGEVG